MMYRKIIAVCSESHTKDINTLCGQNVEYLGAAVKLQKANNNFVMSVRLSARNKSAPSRRFLMKFIIYIFFENLSRNLKFH
jgi:hypothetical protein